MGFFQGGGFEMYIETSSLEVENRVIGYVIPRWVSGDHKSQGGRTLEGGTGRREFWPDLKPRRGESAAVGP